MNDQTTNPYDAVIADLRAKRDHIDQLIQFLELFKGGVPIPSMIPQPTFLGVASGTPLPLAAEAAAPIPPGTFHGKGIEEATRVLLKTRKRTMSAQDIAIDLRDGGLHLQSETPANTIASVLSRGFKGGSDIVRVSRGQWGLQEWYPTRRFDRGGGDE
jgi:hypothetical protein